jgi:protein involved in polysaccharide export with SLBB domain
MWTRSIAAFAGLALSSYAAQASDQVLRAGDRLKISFFERLEVSGGQAPAQPGQKGETLLSIYQRADLSGEFSVEADGSISLPVFGAVEAGETSPASLSARLGSLFQEVFGRSSYITVGVVQRAPVYVLGPVRNPGSFAYRSGMTVLHALALAGGVSDQLQVAQLVEVTREQERLVAARDRVRRLVAKRAVLVARRDGTDTVELSSELSQAAAPGETSDLVARELVLTRLQGQREAKARAAAESSVASIETELSFLRQRATAFDGQLGARAERLKTIEALFARQVVEHQRLGEARSEYFDLLARRKDLDVVTLQAEQRLDQARRTVETIDLERRLTGERLLTETEVELSQARQAAAALEKTVALMQRSVPQLALTDLSATFEVVRTTPKGPETVQVTSADPLQPADVLRVGIQTPRGLEAKVAAR